MFSIKYKIAEISFLINLYSNIINEEFFFSFLPFLNNEEKGKKEDCKIDLYFKNKKATSKPPIEAQLIGNFLCAGYNHRVYFNETSYYIEIYDKILCIACIIKSDIQFRQSEILLFESEISIIWLLKNAIMIVYTFFSAHKNHIVIHSSVVIHKNKAFLFLGKSGEGKSTHAKLWINAIPDCSLLNDDNPVLYIKNNIPFVSGSPWSGDTPCYINSQYAIAGFIRLTQGKYNKIEPLQHLESFASLISSTSTMIWDSVSYDCICHTISKIIEKTKSYKMECLPNLDAAILCHHVAT